MVSSRLDRALEPVKDLISPEPLKPMQRLVQGRELLGVDAADLRDGLHVLLVQTIDDVADFFAGIRQPDAHRTAVDARALMIEKTHLDQLLQIVGNARKYSVKLIWSLATIRKPKLLP